MSIFYGIAIVVIIEISPYLGSTTVADTLRPFRHFFLAVVMPIPCFSTVEPDVNIISGVY